MPVNYPGNVLNWRELLPNPDPDSILAMHDATRLLIQAFPGRYEKYSVLALRRKMAMRTVAGGEVPGLRIWTHTVGNQEASAFFFLRNRGPSIPAYAMSIGLHPNFNAVATIYAALLPLCEFMATQISEGLEIVNDLGTPAQGNQVLTDVVTHANAQAQAGRDKIYADGIIDPGDPWPANLNRWKVDPRA